MSSAPANPQATAAGRGRFALIMGTSACGKSTVGEMVVKHLQKLDPQDSIRFVDADVYHPKANVDKMAQGIPLTDADRASWLHQLAAIGREAYEKNETVLLGCSALKRAYRLVLFGIAPNLAEAFKMDAEGIEAEHLAAEGPDKCNPSKFIVHLSGSKEVMTERINARKGHFAKVNLLESQFATLQAPTQEECKAINVHLLTVDLDRRLSTEEYAAEVASWLQSHITGEPTKSESKAKD